MVNVVEELLALADRKLVAAVSSGALVTDSTVVSVGNGLGPGRVAAGEVGSTCPLVIAVYVEPMPGVLSNRQLQGVEVGVLVIAVVGDSLRPTASACGQCDVGIDCRRVVRVRAGFQ